LPEKLLAKGDMLMSCNTRRPMREKKQKDRSDGFKMVVMRLSRPILAIDALV